MIKVRISKEGQDHLICDENGNWIAVLRGMEGADDRVEISAAEDCVLLLWKRTVRTPADRMIMEAHFEEPCVHSMIPAVLYDGNPVGEDHQYRGKDIPYVIAGHRSAIPGAGSSVGLRHSFAMWSSGDCSGSLYSDGDKMIYRILWPLQEGPQVLMSDGWGEAYSETMPPRKDFEVWAAVGSADSPAWHVMLSRAWEQGKMSLREHSALKGVCEEKNLWEAGIDYAKRLYTEETDGFTGFAIGLEWKGGRWRKRVENRYEAAWCGQNISLAVSLLHHARKNKDAEAARMAQNVLNSWITMARSENGLFLTHYGDSHLIDAVNLGSSLASLLEAAEELRMQDLPCGGVEEAARNILQFILRCADDGSLPFAWDDRGCVLSRSGSGGAFLIPALTAGFQWRKDPEMLLEAERSYRYYVDEFRRLGYGSAAALDTGCVDKESAIPLLKAGLSLYEITGKEEYLKGAEDAAWYLSTWQWHQTNHFPAGSGLARLRYETFGGTSVSVSHHHMDAYALFYVPELWKLGEITSNPQWKERSAAIWKHGIQGVSDGTLTLYDNDIRPRGSSDEGYVHTNWEESPQEKDYGMMPGRPPGGWLRGLVHSGWK